MVSSCAHITLCFHSMKFIINIFRLFISPAKRTHMVIVHQFPQTFEPRATCLKTKGVVLFPVNIGFAL